MALPERKTLRLRRGRVSQSGGRYFLTLCTHARQPVFAQESEARRVTSALHAVHAAGDIELLAATVMPDHVHSLFVLGSRLSLGQVMAKLKNLARDGGKASWRWQEDGFEHHLRPRESTEDYGFYIFMNPYRAGLCRLNVTWPWWICPEAKRFAFPSHLSGHAPVPPEWLGDVDKVATSIATGE